MIINLYRNNKVFIIDHNIKQLFLSRVYKMLTGSIVYGYKLKVYNIIQIGFKKYGTKFQ